MARKKKQIPLVEEKPAEISVQEISNVLETNYMPYAMSVIVSRSIPEIDGFKASHRKLLYTMYKMGLMTGNKTKSANVVGATMKLNPHGDAAIYETMVRLTTGKEALLHPFVESKGTFGKQYSDIVFAASRYTEVKLDKICEYVFGGIEKDAVDFTDNYDHTMTEPLLLPVAFPNVLVSPNSGIAVGIACNICSFNLNEICDATIHLLKNGSISEEELFDIVKAPDFTTGAQYIYDKEKLSEVYRTGHGSIRLRSKYRYDKKDNCIEVYEIPYTTTVESIKDSIVKLTKEGVFREIADVRDEVDKDGMKLAIDIKRGVDPDKLMAKLFRNARTHLEDTFRCNFNVLICGSPRVLGIADLLDEWSAFRIECLRRVFTFDWEKKKARLHLLEGLKKILLDIDKAIRIIRHTEKDSDVIPNLMSGFGIDELQAEYIANIKLRNLNKEYLLDNIDEIEWLEKEVEDLYSLIQSNAKIRKYIIKELEAVKAKYGKPRKTEIVYEDAYADSSYEEDDEPDYPVTVFLSKEGYFKKCTAQSLRGNDVQKFKENDELFSVQEATNKSQVIFFTDRAQVYKARLSEFEDSKASSLGQFVPVKLGFDQDEKVIAAWCVTDLKHDFVFFFENGKAVKIPASAYETKANRRKLKNAFFDGAPCVGVFISGDKNEYLVRTDSMRALLIKDKQITKKTTRTSYGSSVFTLKKGQKVILAKIYDKEKEPLQKESRYRKTALPSAGGIFEEEDVEFLQQTLI